MKKTTLTACLRGLIILFVFGAFFSYESKAQSPSTSFSVTKDETPLNNRIITDLDITSYQLQLVSAPMEFTEEAQTATLLLELPWYDGSTKPFEVVESPIMTEDFANAYPTFRTYAVRAIGDQLITGRVFVSEFGIFASLLLEGNTVGIRPVNLKNPVEHEIYLGRHEADYDLEQFGCSFDEDIVPFLGKDLDDDPKTENTLSNGATLKEYNLAIVTTGEFHDGNGGSVASATAVVTSSVNAIQTMFDKDIAVRFNLLTPMIYTDPNTDPFDPAGAGRTVQAAEAVNDNFNLNDYDIGHCFHDSNEPPGGFAGGGVAGLGVVCNNNTSGISGTGYNKAAGWSGSGNNTTNGWHQLAAHEFGHMFDATHTWNGSGGSCSGCPGGNQSASTSYEIGSGTTIMSYQGICAANQNIPASGVLDNYFHANSLERMVDYINDTGSNQGGSCPTETATGNTPPTSDANPCSASMTIPKMTPFMINGEATDADGDDMTICWEQYDEDGVNVCPTHGYIGQTAADSDLAPLFRSFPPTTSTERVFPQMSDIVNGIDSDFDVLPNVTRTLHFRMTVRDNNANGGGMSCSEVSIDVDDTAGPFEVTLPNGGETYMAGGNVTVTWDQANTSGFCTDVNILMSVDGGYTYPFVLASGVTNTDETWTGTIPSGAPNVTTARIKVECADWSCMTFFDISDADFEITSDCLTESNYICPTDAMTFPENDPGLDLTLDNFFGVGISSQDFDIESSDPDMVVVTHEVGGSGCEDWGFTSDYEHVVFTVEADGDYTFSHNAGAFTINSVFTEATWDPNDPCVSFIGSNAMATGGGGASSSSSFTVTLSECTEYRLCAYNFGPDQNYTVTMAGAGSLNTSTTGPGANYSYTFAAVDTSNDQIDAQDSGADFTSLAVGSYNIYGATYKSGGPTPPNNVDPATWIGMTISEVLSGGDCALFSTNFKPLTVTGGGSCNIDDSGLANTACNDNGTGCDDTDDYITFDLNPTGTNLGATYNVTVSSGTITPTSGTYGSATTFQLQNGSAGAGNVTVTITDVDDANCTFDQLITDPGECSNACDVPSISANCSSPTVDFAGFTGAGFTTNPGAGELCSNTWTFTGFSNTYIPCGNNTTGDFARGDTDGMGETTGGIYGYDDGAGNMAIWIQPTGGDFTPGEAILKMKNTSGGTLTDLDLSYDILFLNDQDRANSLNFSYSTDGTNYTDIAALDFTTPATASGAPVVETEARMTTITGLSIANNADFWLKWTGNDVSGSGSRDEYGLDNITVCPAVCNISASGLANVQCNDNGTPSDPSDDYITFDLDPTGSNLGATYNVTVSSGTITPTSGTYGSATTFQLQNGSAGAGNVTVTITDVDDSNCTFMETITDPGTCSPDCAISSAGLSNIQCNDNGTSSDPSDDYITFELNPTGNNLGTSYTVTGATLTPAGANYGSSVVFQTNPGTAGAGDLNLTIVDDDDNNCTWAFTVTDPGTCSPDCGITDAGLTNVQCNNNGTPSDASDDYITFDLNPTGNNLGTSYNVSGVNLTPTSGTYGVVTSFQTDPGTAGQGDLNLTITDKDDSNCTLSFTVTDPGTCSPDCEITASGLANIQCNDNGTPADDSDDYITFDLNPTGFNLGASYTVTGANLTPMGGNYGAATSFQTDPGTAGAGDLNLTIEDDATGGCTLAVTVTDPGACSTNCNLTGTGFSNLQCNNNGTQYDPSDDYFTFDLNPTGVNLSPNGYNVSSSVTITPSSANYGSATSFQTPAGSAGGGNLTITVEDMDDPNCTASSTLTDPTPNPNIAGTSDPTSCGGTDGSITIGGLVWNDDYNVIYDLGASTDNVVSNLTADANGEITLDNLSEGSYTNIRVQDVATGCIGGSLSATLNDPMTPTYTVSGSNPTQCGASDGSFTISGLTANTTFDVTYDDDGNGVGPLSLTSDSNGEITIDNLDAGDYTNIIVTFAGNCSGAAANVTLSDPANPNPNIAGSTDPTTCGGSDGTITIGGLTAGETYTANYDFNGNGASQTGLTANGSGEITLTGLSAGNYTNISVTNEATNCSGGSLSQTLSDPSAPTYSLGTLTDPSSCGGSDGSIQLTGLTASTTYEVTYDFGGNTVGPLSIMTNSSGELLIENLAAGDYTNIIVSLAGCSGNPLSATLNNPNSPNLSETHVDVTCPGGSDGSIDLSVSGGTPGYTYDWDNDGTGDNDDSEDLSGLSAGTYTVIVTDAAGCSETLSVTIADGVDNTDPTAICQDITVELGSSGTATITTADIDNGSNDNCPPITLSLDITSFNCNNIGANTVTLTAEDGSGNTDDCTATVTVEDNIDPTALCQDITVNLDGTGNVTITPAQINNGSSDNCGTTNLSLDNNSFNCGNIGANTVTLTVNDGNGNSDDCTANVTVQDNEDPTAICQDVTVQLDGSGNASVNPSQIDNGSSDNCGTVIPTLDITDFDCDDVGGNTVTLTVNDGNGNTATCTATVTVEDDIDPTAVCQDITVELDGNGMATITPAQIDNGSSDNCPNHSLSLDITTFDCGDIGMNDVVLTVTDASGNTSSCMAKVTVEDNLDPVLTCIDITVSVDGTGNAMITAANVSNSGDNCGSVTVTLSNDSFNCGNLGPNIVTVTADDGNGNTDMCDAIVTIIDDIDPNALCQDVTIVLDGNGNATITETQINNGSTDNCGTTNLSLDNSSFDCSNVGANTVTLTVDDGNGNSASCTATVTVEDNQAPIAACQDITVELDLNGEVVVAPAQIDNGSSDNCPNLSLSLDVSFFTCGSIGANTVNLTVTDAGGNTNSCSATVTVEDNLAPVIDCTDITVSLNAVGQAMITPGNVVTAFDNCPTPVTLSLSDDTFDCGDIGVNTITAFADDNNGNTSNCLANITVVDDTDPLAECQDVEVQLDASGNASVNPSDIDDGSSDNCGNVTLTLDITDFDCNNLGANTVTLTANDGNGNTATCTATVTVKDDNNPCCDAPMAMCMDITIDLGLLGSATITPADVNDGSLTDCGLMGMTVMPNTFDCNNTGTNTVTLTVTDLLGSTDDCTATVTVQDIMNPDAKCKDASVILDSSGNGTITTADVDDGSSDECGIASLSLSKTDFNCQDVGPNLVVLTATDNSGNTSTCVSLVGVFASLACTPPDVKNEDGPNIADPCTCRGNGEFDEEVVITSGSNQDWRVVTTTLLDPNTLTAFAAGTPFTEIPDGNGNSEYILTGVHLDGVGYTLEAESPFWPGQNLSISNLCHYPNPVIENLDGVICLGTPPITLSGNAGAGVQGSGSFTINGLPATIFDPEALGAGQHLVSFTFNAGNPANALLPHDVGCTESTFLNVQIIETPTTQTCNDLEHVSLDPNCEAYISPDIILEGDFFCDDDYIIEITDHTQDPVSNPVSGSYIGELLTVTITHIPTGNSCWGQITVEDKSRPVLENCPNRTIPCTSNINQAPKPSASDNCDSNPTENLVNLEQIDDEPCDDNMVKFERTWTAVDDYGNESLPCTDIVTIQRPEPETIDFPDDITWQCDQYNEFPNIINPTKLHSAISDTEPADLDIDVDPNLSDNILKNTGSGETSVSLGTYCAYEATQSQITIESCGETFKIVRTWTVLDWCTGLVVTMNNQGEDNKQIIDILDEVAPEIVMDDFEVNANNPASHPQMCYSTELLPAANITDNCSDFTVKIFTPAGEAIYVNGEDGKDGGFIPAVGLPLGDHTVTYTATDECGNTFSHDVTVTVTDLVSPVAVCDQITDVNLTSDGTAVVFADTYDDGSHDQCCLDYFAVARMTDGCGFDAHDFQPTVTFCCEDAANSPVTVIFRAYDCDGNHNDCMVEVNVSDKGAPTLIDCPTQHTIICDFYMNELELAIADGDYSVLDQFGTPEYHDNCDLEITQTVIDNVDQCGDGNITRSWAAVDPSGNNAPNCTQIIRVNHVSDWVVEFPADETVTCDDEEPEFGEPKITDETCELIAISYEDVLFSVVPDACYKIARTWSVINWCVVGDFVDEEVVEVPESEIPFAFPLCDLDGDGDCDDRTFRDSWNGIMFPSAAGAGVDGAPDTDPDLNPWDGYIEYEQVIKVIDNVAPVFADGCETDDVCIEGNSCDTDVSLKMPAIQDCSPDVVITQNGDLGAGFSFSNVEPGIYSVIYTAMDQCGNSNSCQTTIEVSDCKKPTPYCKNGLIAELMVIDTPMVELWAIDFNEGSFDNCPGELKYSFSADTTETSVIFTCDHIGQQFVELWVTDAAGNQDYCQTIVFIQANMNQCPQIDDPLLAGTISTESDETVKDVEVHLNTNVGINDMMKTDEPGEYFFNVPAGIDLTLTPIKDINYLNGVTTYDLVLMSKHILGVNPLDSPYKMIAADANKSNSVTTFDIVLLRKLILFIDTELSNNTSWRFIPTEFEFENPQNPFSEAFPEVININNFNGVDDADFVGIKIGDVNGSVDPLELTQSEDRTFIETLNFRTEEREMKAGETYQIDFTSDNFEAIGYQFTMNFDQNALEFIEINNANATFENFGLALLEEGAITSSWSKDEIQKLAENEVVFSMTFKAKTDSKLSEVLNINSRYTPAEAYGQNGELKDIVLIFNGAPAITNFELYQNRPNPFNEATVISFQLPEATTATLTISDVSGRTLKVIKGDFTKGYNEITIEQKEISGSGVLYYQLDTPKHTASRKMILLGTK